MNLKRKNGITLTELIVASVLIGIVMIGVASFSVSIQQLQGATNKSTVLAMKVRSAIARIAKDASLTVGDSINPGIRTWSGGGTKISICFRHADNDPSSYTDDKWICYFLGSGADDLWYCGETPESDTPPQNMGDCNTGEQQKLIELDPAQNVFYTIVPSIAQLSYIELTISALYNQSLTEHPITNPSHTLTTKINPMGYSR